MRARSIGVSRVFFCISRIFLRNNLWAEEGSSVVPEAAGELSAAETGEFGSREFCAGDSPCSVENSMMEMIEEWTEFARFTLDSYRYCVFVLSWVGVRWRVSKEKCVVAATSSWSLKRFALMKFVIWFLRNEINFLTEFEYNHLTSLPMLFSHSNKCKLPPFFAYLIFTVSAQFKPLDWQT